MERAAVRLQGTLSFFLHYRCCQVKLREGFVSSYKLHF